MTKLCIVQVEEAFLATVEQYVESEHNENGDTYGVEEKIDDNKEVDKLAEMFPEQQTICVNTKKF